MACWDMVDAAPVDVWVRPISWAVTGDAGKVIWIRGSVMKNDKRKMLMVIFVLRFVVRWMRAVTQILTEFWETPAG